MNDYEERKQARIDRYRERAEKAHAESHSFYKQSTDMASAIPAGQPVHGPADRRYREKIGRKMDQSIAALEKADYYERKARSAISRQMNLICAVSSKRSGPFPPPGNGPAVPGNRRPGRPPRTAPLAALSWQVCHLLNK